MLTTQVQLCPLLPGRCERGPSGRGWEGALPQYAGWVSASGGLQGRMRPSASFSSHCLVCGSFLSPLRHMERSSCGTMAGAFSWRWRRYLLSVLAPELITRVCNGLRERVQTAWLTSQPLRWLNTYRIKSNEVRDGCYKSLPAVLITFKVWGLCGDA